MLAKICNNTEELIDKEINLDSCYKSQVDDLQKQIESLKAAEQKTFTYEMLIDNIYLLSSQLPFFESNDSNSLNDFESKIHMIGDRSAKMNQTIVKLTNELADEKLRNAKLESKSQMVMNEYDKSNQQILSNISKTIGKIENLMNIHDVDDDNDPIYLNNRMQSIHDGIKLFTKSTDQQLEEIELLKARLKKMRIKDKFLQNQVYTLEGYSKAFREALNILEEKDPNKQDQDYIEAGQLLQKMNHTLDAFHEMPEDDDDLDLDMDSDDEYTPEAGKSKIKALKEKIIRMQSENGNDSKISHENAQLRQRINELEQTKITFCNDSLQQEIGLDILAAYSGRNSSFEKVLDDLRTKEGVEEANEILRSENSRLKERIHEIENSCQIENSFNNEFSMI